MTKMTVSEYLQIHDAALLDAAAIIGLRGRAAASPENHFVLLNASTGTCHWWLERVGFLLHVLPKTATRRAETIEPRLKHMMKDGGGKAQRDSRGHEKSIRLGASSEARPHAGGSIAASTAFVQASAHQ